MRLIQLQCGPAGRRPYEAHTAREPPESGGRRPFVSLNSPIANRRVRSAQPLPAAAPPASAGPLRATPSLDPSLPSVHTLTVDVLAHRHDNLDITHELSEHSDSERKVYGKETIACAPPREAGKPALSPACLRGPCSEHLSWPVPFARHSSHRSSLAAVTMSSGSTIVSNDVTTRCHRDHRQCDPPS